MAQDMTGVISLQPGTWSVQIAIPADWDMVEVDFQFTNGDAERVDITGTLMDSDLNSVLVEWTNNWGHPIRVDYRVAKYDPNYSGGTPGGIGG